MDLKVALMVNLELLFLQPRSRGHWTEEQPGQLEELGLLPILKDMPSSELIATPTKQRLLL